MTVETLLKAFIACKTNLLIEDWRSIGKYLYIGNNFNIYGKNQDLLKYEVFYMLC